jgi:hypothetical protein
LAQVLETVRTRLLNFALELQEMNPEITVSEEAISEIPIERSLYVFQTYIYGNQNVVATGVGVEQSVHQKIISNDIEALLRYMREEVGVSQEDVDELEVAISEDGSRREANRFGPRVRNWILKITKKTLEGTIQVGTAVATTMIEKALLRYYGWDS